MSIPGYVSQPDNALFRKAVREAGCAIIGQTADLAPADKRFYAIRDVTATVESVPLITASILSKKLAAGLQSLVLDVKVGNGAFMAKTRDAPQLATSLVEVANGAGLKTTALITGMNEPLASAAGNAVEVAQRRRFPHRPPPRPAARGRDAGARRRDAAVGRHRRRPTRMGCGAPTRRWTAARRRRFSAAWWRRSAGRPISSRTPRHTCRRRRSSLRSRRRETALSPAIATRDIGLAVVALGGGRTEPDDAIDHAVGITALLPVGAEVRRGRCRWRWSMPARDGCRRAPRPPMPAAYTIGATKPAGGRRRSSGGCWRAD